MPRLDWQKQMRKTPHPQLLSNEAIFCKTVQNWGQTPLSRIDQNFSGHLRGKWTLTLLAKWSEPWISWEIEIATLNSAKKESEHCTFTHKRKDIAGQTLGSADVFETEQALMGIGNAAPLNVKQRTLSPKQ